MKHLFDALAQPGRIQIAGAPGGQDARVVAELEPDGSEDLEVVLIPLAEIGQAIGDGRIRHSQVISALTLVFGLGPHRALPPQPED